MKYAVKNLPDYLKKVLREELKFHKREITVEARTTITAQAIADDGCRAFTVIVDLANQRHHIEYGSWGSNAFVHGSWSRVDTDDKTRPMPPNGIVIKGSEGGGRPVHATIYAHPDMLQKQLAAEVGK